MLLLLQLALEREVEGSAGRAGGLAEDVGDDLERPVAGVVVEVLLPADGDRPVAHDSELVRVGEVEAVHAGGHDVEHAVVLLLGHDGDRILDDLHAHRRDGGQDAVAENVALAHLLRLAVAGEAEDVRPSGARAEEHDEVAVVAPDELLLPSFRVGGARDSRPACDHEAEPDRRSQEGGSPGTPS
ncbi:MAG: hypothetical protein RIF41_35285 [Polyangiaceae bacterium]